AGALQTFWTYLARHAPELTVLRFDEGLVTTSVIAVRLDVSRETPRTWAVGARGGSDFPVHVAVVGQQRVWRCAAVCAWAEAHGGLTAAGPRPLDAATVTRVSAQLLEGNAGFRTVAGSS